MVNFACNHKAGRAPRFSGWKKIFAAVANHSSCFQLVGSSGDLVFGGSSGMSGIGEHQDSSAGDLVASV